MKMALRVAIALMILLSLSSSVNAVLAHDNKYYVAGHPSTYVSQGRGIRGSLMIWERSFESWFLDRPYYRVQINIQDYGLNNFAEGGLAYQQDPWGIGHLYLFMSVMDSNELKTIWTEEIAFPSQPYKIELIRNVQNPKRWYMLVWRPGAPGYETWYYYDFKVEWVGRRLESQTEGGHQPTQGQSGLKVGEFTELQWYNMNTENWVNWPDCVIYAPTSWHVQGTSVSATSWYSWIDW